MVTTYGDMAPLFVTVQFFFVAIKRTITTKHTPSVWLPVSPHAMHPRSLKALTVWLTVQHMQALHMQNAPSGQAPQAAAGEHLPACSRCACSRMGGSAKRDNLFFHFSIIFRY